MDYLSETIFVGIHLFKQLIVGNLVIVHNVYCSPTLEGDNYIMSKPTINCDLRLLTASSIEDCVIRHLSLISSIVS